MAAKHHVNLKVVEEFLRRKIYPKEIAKDKGKKANFRRTCKNFSIKDGELEKVVTQKSMNANEYLKRETFGRGKIFLI